ncbi:MAG: heme ABC transporter ATP-binding protein [Verrucomicrobia bacterium]|nr:heme ABC transporter ATP-binding protein [Verrucomicrobiota bacterium]
MIEVREISFTAGTRTLLNGVGFRLEPGRFYGLLGPNGAGKSTLLRLLSGELKPSTGSICFNDRELSNWPLRELAQIRGALPQRAELSFEYTVEEVVALGRSPFGEAEDESVKGPLAIESALQAFELESLRNRSYLKLSGGEQQRVQLARVFAQVWRAPGDTSTRFLLLDEPATGLDLSHQQSLLQLLRETARQNTLVLAALHDPNQVAAHADELLMLCGGKLVAQGSVETVLDAALLEQFFCVKAETLRDAKNGKSFRFHAHGDSDSGPAKACADDA